MNLRWLFSAEAPLPLGHRLAVFPPETQELAQQRLDEAAAVLGPEAARGAAGRLGLYELDDESVRRLGLAGACTGKNGEVEALSPARWAELPRREARPVPEAGTEVAGLLLTTSQRESFLRFLTRNPGRDNEELAPEHVVRIARHFFFQEPIVVVLRYTPPRFASS